MPGTTDTVKAMLTPGEFVIRKEAVDMIGVPILEKLNDMPEAGGHSEIDRLIAKATLKNMTGMYGGGMVNAKQYMGGGMIEQYMGGGKVDMYGHGGKVKNQMMMGYEHGGEAHGNLKPVPDDNPGLAKLPEKVRNKMGYMQEGGSVLDMALRRAEPMQLSDPKYQNLTNMLNLQDPYSSLLFKIADIKAFTDPKTGRYLSPEEEGYGKSVDTNKGILRKIREMDYASKQGVKPSKGDSKDVEKLMDLVDKLGLMGMMKGGMAKKKKKYGYQEGGEILGLNITPESVFQAVYQMPTDDGDRYYLGEAQRPLPNLSRKLSIKRAMDKAMNAPQDSITFDMAQQILNPEEEKSGFLKKLLGMQEGGAVQDDAMMLQFLQSLQAGAEAGAQAGSSGNSFIPFDQRPPSSGEMMSPIPSGMEQGDMMRIIRDEREVLDMEDAELLRQKGKNFFEKLRLDSLQSKILDSLMQLDSGRIERLPADTSEFMPSSSMFSPKGMGI